MVYAHQDVRSYGSPVGTPSSRMIRAYDPLTGKSDIEFDRYAADKLMSYCLTKQQAWKFVSAEMPDHDCRPFTKLWRMQIGFAWKTRWSPSGAGGCSAKFCLLVP
jgi:hypothetical protein